MAEQKAAAFMSYVHADDRYGHVKSFHEHLSHEVETVVGFDFPIFLDSEDIMLGQSWRRRIEEALDEALFFIPILTPSFFNSEYCRAELRRFLEREKKLGRDDLILPVYFVDARVLNEEDLRAEDELAAAIAARQRADWRNLRHEQFTTPLVGRTLEKLAMQIRDALPRLRQPRQKPPPAPARTEARQSSAPAEESGAKTAPPQPTKVEPPTKVVDLMHRGDFTTIAEAISSCAPGTRILVRPGPYCEALVINKPLEIIGEGGPGEVVLHASGTHVVQFQTTMGRITNLTIRQTGSGNWLAVDIAQGRLEIEGCDITSQSYACVAIHNGADPRLRRNRIHGGKQSGVYIYDNGLGTLEDNDIFGNTFSGVEIRNGANPTLRHNRIYDGRAAGVTIYDSGLSTIEDNDIYRNDLSGVHIKSGANPTVRRNRIHDGKRGGVLVYEKGLGMLEDNDIFGNASSGVEIREGGNPTFLNNRINKNVYYAIWVHDGGSGTFEGNNLRENQRGAWNIASDCLANVKRSNNFE